MRQQRSFYWFSFQHQQEKSTTEEVQKCVNCHKVKFNLDAPSWNRSSQSMHYGRFIHLDKVDHCRFVIFCTYVIVRLHCAVVDAVANRSKSHRFVKKWSSSTPWCLLYDNHLLTFSQLVKRCCNNNTLWLLQIWKSYSAKPCYCNLQSILFWRIVVLLQNWVELRGLGSLRNAREAGVVSLPTSHLMPFYHLKATVACIMMACSMLVKTIGNIGKQEAWWWWRLIIINIFKIIIAQSNFRTQSGYWVSIHLWPPSLKD